MVDNSRMYRTWDRAIGLIIAIAVIGTMFVPGAETITFVAAPFWLFLAWMFISDKW